MCPRHGGVMEILVISRKFVAKTQIIFISDCPDGEDEKNCDGAPPPNITNVCAENEFVCRDQHFCIHQAWACDGDKDCPDGTDEDEDLCGEKPSCAENEFTCSSGQCIQGHLQCSGRADCDDHSDEEDCGKYLMF